MAAVPYVDMCVLRLEQYALAAQVAAVDVGRYIGPSGIAPRNV